MSRQAKEYIRLFRVHQWIKNSFVLVPLIFSNNLFNLNLLPLSFGGFIVFCLASSFVYVINDIIDVEADKAHAVKQFRPIASGRISINAALAALIVLAVVILISFIFFNTAFDLLCLGYIILNLLYSLWLKNVVIIDMFCIAAGFMIRVIAGGVIINVEISNWLILSTMFISLFLAIMKRRSELTLSPLNSSIENTGNSSRKVLKEYTVKYIDQLGTIAASGVLICYTLYTVAERTVSIFRTEDLIFTVPFVVFGIFRYMYLVYIDDKGENTSKILLTDLAMILNILLYILTVILIIYL